MKILQELPERIHSLEEQQVYLDNELRKSQAEKEEAALTAAENLAVYRRAEDKIRTLEERLREVDTSEGAWRRVARARAQVPRSAARRVPVSGWAAQSPAAGGRQRGV